MASQLVALPVDEYERLFAILDACSQAETLDAFKNALMGALHEHYDCLNTTFFAGPTFVTAFSDPTPVVTGRIMPVIDEYQARWYPKDVFASTQSRAALSKNPAISANKLGGLAGDSVSYLQDFLYRKQLHSASVMHLDLANDCHGLVGLFDSEGREPDRARLHAMGLLSRQLSNLAKLLPGQPLPSWRECLSPRQIELAELVADGHTNEEIASILNLGVDTVKKYVSRVFAATRVRNRAELVKLVCMEGREPNVALTHTRENAWTS
ncbi:helix-turn-helix transcriptional regulator [Gordonia alkanivorans]|uniref:helix-turn-helix transcriptional regulator n=1 Tax=Gordonia alkanivorans TaxID=84096 RepID=UPI00244C82BA|nr:helix-turn-helix transcriptional regulator [Gordonia alkanivorans]MDH3009374.1 helix-turn-helix transcriptional regulator [Gordonia alkanivorans]MDH3014519.1 helix-turn-helix transcriptional regulator [Gordonia alkanivorans]MDH3043611.1 helix-turn-helix transcriptional regulator [Gordonia alkanivorans]